MIQLSVFIENEPGKLLQLTSLLSDEGINISAITIAEAQNFGVVRMIVDNPDKAQEALREGGLVSQKTEVTAIEVPDKPGALTALLRSFEEDGVNIEYMYGFLKKESNLAVMIMRFKDAETAKAALKKHNIKTVEA